eukprot:TRINITY_DN45434_c0_g1_i1.p1 TRINITY_DN45434_c0_g1~~TRINITY_DN45434_c0_g1_i1.p1  ORF type:complete len:251 (-),score=29.77 TRINITY_DN45434_c0_g1_i1:56-808(-)
MFGDIRSTEDHFHHGDLKINVDSSEVVSHNSMSIRPFLNDFASTTPNREIIVPSCADVPPTALCTRQNWFPAPPSMIEHERDAAVCIAAPPRLHRIGSDEMLRQQADKAPGTNRPRQFCPFGQRDIVEEANGSQRDSRGSSGIKLCLVGCLGLDAPNMDVAVSEEKPEEPVISIGSVGHPHNCGLACKFTQKKRGCRKGAKCTRCHFCTWEPAVETRKVQESSACMNGFLSPDTFVSEAREYDFNRCVFF